MIPVCHYLFLNHSKHHYSPCGDSRIQPKDPLIRLYPTPYRYLEGNEQFSKYQWIKVEIRKSRPDDRPESYIIREGTIISGSIINAQGDGWEERGKWIPSSNNLYESVEALSQAGKKENISLGIIKPKEIRDFKIVKKSDADIKVAIFGVPKVHEDDPVRTIRAAREIHEQVEALSPEIEKKIGQPISMPTGINTGLVVTGKVDAEKGTQWCVRRYDQSGLPAKQFGKIG